MLKTKESVAATNPAGALSLYEKDAMMGADSKVDASQRMLNVDEPLQEGKKLQQYVSSLVVCLTAIQSGMTLGWSSPICPYLKSGQSFLPAITDEEESWISSLLAIGAIVGAVPFGKVADRIGRKKAVVIPALPYLVSWGLLIFTRNLMCIYLARFVAGIGTGAVFVLVPVYVGEIAETSIRGALGIFLPLFFSFGLVYAYTAGAYVNYISFNVTCALMLVPFLICVPFIPESPMWLVHKGRKLEASKVLEVLRGPDYDVKREISILQEEVSEQEKKKGGFRDIVKTKAGRKAMVTCLGIMWFQQASGVDAILFYTVLIFKDAGSTIDPNLATIVIGMIEVVMTVIVALVIDKYGRKPLLIVSGSAMALCLGVFGYYLKLKDDGTDVTSIGWLPFTCLSLFNVVFSVGFGAVPFTIISEIFPLETKGVATSICIVFSWALVFTVTKLFPLLDEKLGSAVTFWIFAGFCAMASLFTYFFVPETKGKSIQQIQKKLRRRKNQVKSSHAV
ncbi:facilitated trehalose transporter Tret1 isoform X2 [Cephus cinctus]|uniref:Facilitated trehalose transporter Tret1 isoform X2 n=1 Tax=Cephus cinctus TaxID=211228 RepID=A0AAJ7RMD7_CEPCN|nr:facilitated trehalose transporter Tret1 isoform X2 [Cephus cinctus]